MMEKIINIYKPLGLTPVQLIQKLREDRKEYQGTKIGFAGRLDPLAHGVMLLMIDEETKKRDRYLNLPKTYEFEVLFGMSTDTYDALGILQNLNLFPKPNNLKEQIKKFIHSKLGKQIQPYPPYSSIEVGGIPLYQWARENKLSEIKIPEKEIEIYNFEFLDVLEIPADEIHNRIIENINTVEGDFRQEEIVKKWNVFFDLNKNKQFTVAKFRINCSSGTYIRSLASELGKAIGTGAIALDIFRTKVGNYMIENSIRL
jgi:tRNA pseudouridine55 synthase